MKPTTELWIYRLVRWAFGLFFIIIGFMYDDAWAAFIFGGIFIATSFYKKPRCINGACDIASNRNK